VGRLDYLSEGLLIITNDGDLARALELPSNKIERQYKVRVFSRTFDEKTLGKLRQGCVMGGRRYGPYIIEVINRQNTNTWLHLKLYTGKNNEIRRVMRKFSLRVGRLKRVSYGPYTL
jgi:23S rRNA pseudouridine2605 synthase